MSDNSFMVMTHVHYEPDGRIVQQWREYYKHRDTEYWTNVIAPLAHEPKLLARAT